MKYQIVGGNLPAVLCTLEKGEEVYTQVGGMTWMDDVFKMSTNMEGGLLGGFARKMAGESLFLTTYAAQSEGEIAFASGFPGEIKALSLAGGESIICQKDAFLVAERSVTLAAHLKKKIGFGFFGGEGFVMQKITGPGLAFVEMDGSVTEYQLKPGQKMIVDPGHLAMCESTVDLDVQMVKGFKNMFFGGEGLFLTTITGPGKIWLQSMPFSGLAGKVLAAGGDK
ncbi:MAG: TIGR00266 family protein [Acidaminococcales bacterium]|nr:TIGR00266 family protein [Acidaminococcales bacterium]